MRYYYFELGNWTYLIEAEDMDSNAHRGLLYNPHVDERFDDLTASSLSLSNIIDNHGASVEELI